MKKIAAIILAVIAVLGMTACGTKSREAEETQTPIPTVTPMPTTTPDGAAKDLSGDWPIIGPGALIPAPMGESCEIPRDSEGDFYAKIGGVTQVGFNDYVKKCIEAGFKEDDYKVDSCYRAENNEGYELTLNFYESDNSLSIIIRKVDPEEQTEEQIEISTETPQPKATETPKPQPTAASKPTPTPKPQPTAASKPTPTPKPTESKKAGVSPDFKELMDSYEKFMNEYVAFMKKYQNSGNAASMLADYVKFTERYADFVKKVENIDEDSLSAADVAYYSEVMARVTKKLSEVA